MIVTRPAIMPTPTSSETRIRAREFLTKQNLRPTATRAAVVEAIFSFGGWFDAEELLARGRANFRRLSRATVYRLLPVLCRAGLLRVSDFGDGHHRYRRAHPAEIPTAEIFIVNCGKIIERPAPFLTWYGQSIVGQAGLELESLRMHVHARCSHKRAGGDCEDCPHESERDSQNHPS